MAGVSDKTLPGGSTNNALVQIDKKIANGTTDPRVGFSLPKLKHVQRQILIKYHIQNLDQASTSKSQPNISTSTKLNIQNVDQT